MMGFKSVCGESTCNSITRNLRNFRLASEGALAGSMGGITKQRLIKAKSAHGASNGRRQGGANKAGNMHKSKTRTNWARKLAHISQNQPKLPPPARKPRMVIAIVATATIRAGKHSNDGIGGPCSTFF